MLSIATVCIAWSGYQATKWAGHQAKHYAQADAALVRASRSSTLAGEEHLQDLVNFNRWLDAETNGDQRLTDIYLRRFRKEFLPAFNAWLALDPLTNVQAPASPLLMPQYDLANRAKAGRLETVGHARTVQAEHDTENSDNYIFGTVVFAAVLFFAGISMRFAWFPMRVTVLILSGCFLMYGVVHLAGLEAL